MLLTVTLWVPTQIPQHLNLTIAFKLDVQRRARMKEMQTHRHNEMAHFLLLSPILNHGLVSPGIYILCQQNI